MWFRRKFVASLLLLALCAALVPVSAARAEGPKDVLQMVPDDAWGFVILKSLSNLDDKAAQIKDVLGLDQMPSPITPMVLSMLNVGDKVEMTMPLCAVMMDAKKYGGANPGEAMVLLVPAKDPKALLDTLAVKESGDEKKSGDDEGKKPAKEKPDKDAKAGDEGKKSGEDKETAEGITKITVQGQPAFAAIKGKYLIVGSNQECITKVAKTKKTAAEGMPDARTAAADKADVFISIAMSTVVNTYKDMFLPLLQMATAASDPEGKNIKNLVKVLGETSAVDLALTFDKTGLSFLVLMTPQKDSDLAKVMGDMKNSDKSLLAMLPAEKYLFTMGTTGGYSEANEKFGGDNLFSQLIKSSGAKGLNEEAIKSLDAQLLKLTKASGPTAICISFLPEAAEGMFGVTVVADLKDPKAYVEGLRNIYKTVWSVAETPDADKKTEGGKDKDDKGEAKKEGKGEDKEAPKGKDSKVPAKEDIAKLKENIVHAPDAETIDGAKVDTLTFKLEGLADMFDIGDEEVGLVQKIIGKELVLRFGAVDDKHFVLTFGGGKKRFESVCKHLKSPGESLDKDASIKDASGQLPSPRVSEFYLAVDNIAQAAKSVATALGEGEEFPFEVPTVNAPVAVSGAIMGPVQQINIQIPMKLIKAVKEVVTKMSAAGGDFDEDEDAADNDEDDAGGKPAAKPAAKAGEKKNAKAGEKKAPKADAKKDKGKDKGKDKDEDDDDEN